MAENNEREKQKRPTHLRKSFKITIAKSISNLFGSNVLNVKNSADTDSNSFSGKEMDFSSPGSRSNNNEQIHSRLNSISETSTHVSIKSVDAEIESYIKNLLQDSESDVENLPILIPNDGDNFMIEGYISQHDNNLFLGKDGEYLIHDEEIIQTNRAYVNYSKNFYGKEHFNFVGRYENNESVNFVLSVRYDNEKFECIFRNKDGNRYDEIELKELCDNNKESNDVNSCISEAHIVQIFNKINHNLILQEIKPIMHPISSQLINSYDKNLLKNTFTFGIIYQKFGQISEKEILANNENSKEFDEFLEFIGQRITLKNFDKFRGMLDTKNDDTGKESIYECYEDSEIMFHVSTLLPISNKDQQYVERKRHIGNDRVTIIFQDKDTPFSPRMIKSKLLHVFIIIQPVKVNKITKRYKVSVMSRKDVPYFEPLIRPPFIFEKNESLKKFLLSKLINAEFASLKAPAFSSFSEQTIRPGLQKLCVKLNQLTYKFTWLNEPSWYNLAYLYQAESKTSNDLTESPLNINSSNLPFNNYVNKNFPRPLKLALRKISDVMTYPAANLMSKDDDREDEKEKFSKIKPSKLSRKASKNLPAFNLDLKKTNPSPTKDLPSITISEDILNEEFKYSIESFHSYGHNDQSSSVSSFNAKQSSPKKNFSDSEKNELSEPDEAIRPIITKLEKELHLKPPNY